MCALVTGFLERGELPEEAVAREVREEVNLEAVSVRLLGVYPFVRKNEVIIGYHVQARGEIILNEELAEYRLIAPEHLRPWPQARGYWGRPAEAQRAAGRGEDHRSESRTPLRTGTACHQGVP